MQILITDLFLSFFIFCLSSLAFAESKQTTDTLVMISPDTFQYNFQTASSNPFQQVDHDKSKILKKAKQEFNQMVATLRKHKINVIVLPSPKNKITPDAVFPNNWFSVHKINSSEIVLIIYPMLAENRRAERQVPILKEILKAQGIHITKVIDLTYYEDESATLEGTGSMVLDREHKIAFASLSPRTNALVMKKFVEEMHYKPILFRSYDRHGMLIYHTNLMLSVGSHFAIIASDNISDPLERKHIITTLKNAGKDILEITPKQMESMAANVLEVHSINGNSKILLSKTAYDSLTKPQLQQLKQYGTLIVLTIPTIEKIGGGGVRCMLAEIFH